MALRPTDRIAGLLKKHNYTELKKIGAGSYGQAILVNHSSDKGDEKAVIKMIDISRASQQEKDDALKESQVLRNLKHPYIVRYRESFLEDGWLCISMDFCEGGDLSDKIKNAKKANKSIPEDQILRWFTQALLALKHCHEKHILHRDLKSGNFFLSKNGNLKMGDFGIAKVMECTAAVAQTQIGTPYYLSPEICEGRAYSWGSDIWSMGVILFEMSAQKVPFDAKDLKGLISRITRDPIPQMPSEYSQPLRTLFQEMMNRNVDRRPSATDVLKKPVVQDVVRKLLGEVKPEEAEKPQANGAAASSAEASGAYAANAGRYAKGDLLEYWSATHGEWLPANVTAADPSGKIMLDIKPNAWLTIQVQSEKVRPRKEEAGATPSGLPPAGPPGATPHPKAAAGVRQASNGPTPRAAGQGSREPSPGNRGRSPGAAGRPVAPQRAPSGGPGSRSREGSRGR